jgi:hypothetical protein
VLDHREVVGDEDVGEVELFLQVLEEVYDLGLDRDIQSAVTLFPLPDSPTIPNVSPGSSEKETPSTALTTPSWVLK